MEPESQITIRDLRRQLSAHKARGYYANHGRGFLITRPLPSNHPLARWHAAHALDVQGYENHYVTLDQLRSFPDCPFHVQSSRSVEKIAELLAMLDEYDPEREAIVWIEYEPGDLDDHAERVRLDEAIPTFRGEIN